MHSTRQDAYGDTPERAGTPAGLLLYLPGGRLRRALAWFGTADRDLPAPGVGDEPVPPQERGFSEWTIQRMRGAPGSGGSARGASIPGARRITSACRGRHWPVRIAAWRRRRPTRRGPRPARRLSGPDPARLHSGRPVEHLAGDARVGVGIALAGQDRGQRGQSVGPGPVRAFVRA